MKFCSHLAVAGILGLLGYGLASGCTHVAGHVYLIWETSTSMQQDGSMYRIMRLSGAPYPRKIDGDVPGSGGSRGMEIK